MNNKQERETAVDDLAGTINDDYDVVIVGGGMVGASLALQLSQCCNSEIRILVVESFPLVSKRRISRESLSRERVHNETEQREALQGSLAPNTPRQEKGVTGNLDFSASKPHYSPSFDARSTALSFGSQKILEPLGIWPSIAEHLSPIDSIHVSNRGQFGSATLEAADVGWPALGYVVENAWLGNVLLGALQRMNNVDFFAPAAVSAITPRSNGVDITINDNGLSTKNTDGDDLEICACIVRSQLVVVADGANSGMREYLGIGINVHDYQQSALISNVSFKNPHNGIAYERFTEGGPMALLPLSETEQGEPRSALVWSMDKERADHLCNCEAEEFLQQLQQNFGHRQGEFTRVGDRFSYPLKLIEAKEQVRSCVVIMGNAAHSMHPVAGQGFNLALRDSARLVSLLQNAYDLKKPLGDLSLLQSYLEQQLIDQRKTILFSDKITALFSHQNKALSLLRGMGLGVLDTMPWAKKEFIVQGAGLHDGAAGVANANGKLNR